MPQASLQYKVPTLSYLGSLAELTLGNHGSTLDGTGLNTQTGGGNDGNPGAVVGGQLKDGGSNPGKGHK